VNDGLQVVENWNAISDVICYGRRGELATNREQRAITLLSLQLLQTCLMLINTILVERALEKHGVWERLNQEDRRALTPLFYTHINPYGVFELDLESPSLFNSGLSGPPHARPPARRPPGWRTPGLRSAAVLCAGSTGPAFCPKRTPWQSNRRHPPGQCRGS